MSTGEPKRPKRAAVRAQASVPAPAPAPARQPQRSKPAAKPEHGKHTTTAAGRRAARAGDEPVAAKTAKARASARAAQGATPPVADPGSPPSPVPSSAPPAAPGSQPAPGSAPPPVSRSAPPPMAEPLLDDAAFGLDDDDPEVLQRQAAETVARIVAQLYPDAAHARTEDNVLDSARQLLSADYYVRRLSRVGMRGRSEHVDDFGLDPAYEERVRPLLEALCERYFRVQLTGAEHVPGAGGALLVCNHGGALPWDGVMLKTALRRALPEREPLRWLTDDFVSHAPFLGAVLSRIGAVRACPENAEQLLERGSLLAVFPEGVKGIEKPYKQRYQLQRFGRGGHVKLALRTGVPVLPVAIVGSEDSYPLLYRVRAFSKLFGLPFIPVTPTFPLLGPLGLLPLPSRWRIVIGERLTELDELDAYAAEDGALVNELNERLRGRVQSLLGEALSARGPNAFA